VPACDVSDAMLDRGFGERYESRAEWMGMEREVQGRRKGGAGKGERGSGHCNIDVLHCHLAMDLLHRRTGVLHRNKGFLVDVRGFDGVDLLLEHRDLAVCLLEGMLVLFFALECVFGHCPRSGASARSTPRNTFLILRSRLTITKHCACPCASCTRLGAGMG
jgi:hypothetical protein